MPIIPVNLRVRNVEGLSEVQFAPQREHSKFLREETNLTSGRFVLLLARVFKASFQGGPRSSLGCAVTEDPSPFETSFVLDDAQVFLLVKPDDLEVLETIETDLVVCTGE